MNAGEAVLAADRNGVKLSRVSDYSARSQNENRLILGFAAYGTKQSRDSLIQLADALHSAEQRCV
jgi:hypothetical protein